MSGRPPTPRSGRLTAGGTNALELLWTQAALAVVAVVGIVAAVGWLALWVEGRLAGTGWHSSLWDMPGLLAQVAAGGSETVAATVVQPWRPVVVAACVGLACIGAGWWGLARWLDWQAGWRHRRRRQDRLTSHSWARRRDLDPLLAARPNGTEAAAAGRLLVGSHRGRDVAVPAATSVMVIAPTRTGKTSRLVVPNLLRWDGPTVVTSVKRDVYDLTVDRRRQVGPTFLFDPTGATGLPTVRWSPLLSSVTFPDATKTATWLADAAAVEDKHEAAKFWETLATKLLAPMLYAAANSRRTIHDVSHWVDRSAFDDVAGILARLGDDDAQAAWHAIRELPHETRGSVLGTAMAIFRAFGSARVRAATSCTPGEVGDDTLDIGRLLADNGSLYLVSPEYEQSELRPLFVALVQAVYRAAVETSANLLAGAPLNPPLLLMLDEAGNIAPLHSLPKIAATGAGQGITLMTIWQDRAQIRQLYGDADRTVIANHSTSVWLPGSQDLDTLKLLSELIGDQWVASSTISAAPDGGLSVSEGSERIDVAPPAFLRTLDHGHAVMLAGNLPPALIDTHAYWQQRRWRQLVDIDVLARHAAMHNGTGPTTAQQWDHEQPPPAPQPAADPAANTPPPHPARPAGGSIRQAVAADRPPVHADRKARAQWGLLAVGIPNRMRAGPGLWQQAELPAELAAQAGCPGQVDLAEVAARRRLLPIWLECGPADLLAATITFGQLADEWPHLALTDVVRHAWEDAYPQLIDDFGPPPPDHDLPTDDDLPTGYGGPK